jgi:hypothetical protein
MAASTVPDTPTPFCTYCHHTLGRMEKQHESITRELARSQEHLHFTEHHQQITPFIRKRKIASLLKKIDYYHTNLKQLKDKISYTYTIMNTHTTRDDDNNLLCPILKEYKCFKCGEHGHTPSRCTPCEYCKQNGHNDRECPKKRADEKHTHLTIVAKLTKKVGYDDLLLKFKSFCHEHGIDIIKEV